MLRFVDVQHSVVHLQHVKQCVTAAVHMFKHQLERDGSRKELDEDKDMCQTVFGVSRGFTSLLECCPVADSHVVTHSLDFPQSCL